MYISVIALCEKCNLHLFVCPIEYFSAVASVVFNGDKVFLIDGESVDKNNLYRVFILM